MAEQIGYSIIQERPDAFLVRTEATRLVGWAPKKNAKGNELTEKEICGIVGRNGVPEKVYQEKGLTSRRSRMVEVSFDNLHYNDKNQVVLVRGGEEKTVAKSYVEQPDMLKKTVLIPAYYANKVGLEGGREMFLTTRTMQYEINRHFSQLEKERENAEMLKRASRPGNEAGAKDLPVKGAGKKETAQHSKKGKGKGKAR